MLIHAINSTIAVPTDITHMANGDEKTRLNEFNSNNLGANLYISFLL